MAWREVSTNSSDLITWDQAKVVTGIYLGGEEKRKEKAGKEIINTLHRIEVEGMAYAFFGTTKLNAGLRQVDAGKLVQIEYTGKQTPTGSGGRIKEFIVRVDDGE